MKETVSYLKTVSAAKGYALLDPTTRVAKREWRFSDTTGVFKVVRERSKPVMWLHLFLDYLLRKL